MIVDPGAAPDSGQGGMHTRHLSVAGGLTQFGAYVDTLQRGAWSSHRHWHSAEDEFLYVLDGTATVIDDDGDHTLHPGDACCWRHGEPNAHHVTNHSEAPCRTLIVGSRAAGDICHYPDSGRRQVNAAATWAVYDANGAVERSGDLPPELLNLPQPWGTPFDGTRIRRILRAKERVWVKEGPFIHPILHAVLGPYSHVRLSDAGGLTQFGAHLEQLPPGSDSSFRHWHETEDELVYILSGTPTLIEDSTTLLQPGDMVCWPAGQPVGHCLVNRSDIPALYLTIGTRLPRDRIHYPDHDLISEKTGTARRNLHADGRERSL